jgi:SagB-type dehydrogenase family enzyme
MNPTETVYHYHDRTKHHPDRYAASLGYMDWATQPDPFRRYHGAALIRLPLTLDAETPPYEAHFETPALALERETLSRLVQFSLGLAAWKSIGNDAWALRCNASSGNLQPTEAYLILPPVEGISEHSSVMHYAPKEHGLEMLAGFDTDVWEALPKGSVLMALNSVLWREAWKYGERAFRYCQLDAGHAQRAVETSAAMLGWSVRRLDAEPAMLERLTGIDQKERYLPEERESADMLLLITPGGAADPDLDLLAKDLPQAYTGRANRLSPSHHRWEIIDTVDRATHTEGSGTPYRFAPPPKGISTPTGEIVLRRRSAQAMDFGRPQISRDSFDSLMASVTPEVPEETPVHFVLFIHHVEGLESGLYILVRNPDHLRTLKHVMRSDFAWEACGGTLYRLETGDFRPQARFISCSQDIASDGAFSLGMLCAFSDEIDACGPHRYKELYWECGAIGQQLYLEATALKLSATGIGCYLDDVLHRMLGLEERRFQSLYHFTVGRAIVDMRLTTLPPYHHL